MNYLRSLNLLAGLACWLTGVAVGADRLSDADAQALTNHLSIIAADAGWPQASVDAANEIVRRPDYSAAAWEGFFDSYFESNTFTDKLFAYLHAPVFYWFDAGVHERLQSGLIRPLLNRNIKNHWSEATEANPQYFANTPAARADMISSMNMLVWMGTHDDLPHERRQEVLNELLALIASHPETLKVDVTLSRENQPYFGTFRMQHLLTALSFLETEMEDHHAFTANAKQRFAEAVGLSGGIGRLWNDFDVLLVDNNSSNERQQQAIHDLLASVPRSLHSTSSITMNVGLGNGPPWQQETIFPIKPQVGFNIAEWDVTLGDENSFPDDGPVGIISPFMAVLAHELTHGIDAIGIQRNPSLAARRDALLRDAGRESLNYLRSMFGDDVFQDAPQEFIASIGNQWFTDSEKTIQLGLTRFEMGRRHPINQALFMAEVFSEGTGETIFYTIDTDANVTAKRAPIARNNSGFIDTLQIDDRIYRFLLDDEGRVASFELRAGGVPGDATLDGLFDSTDLIQVFQAGEYEDTIVGNSTWTTGDWNSDNDFDTSDLVAAFQFGAYERDPLAVATAVFVPEPTNTLFATVGAMCAAACFRRTHRGARANR